ncbi:MAG TPA: RNA 2',3'-cyclic phosphodiesterase [Chitinophagales bacterium]|nr:RNA 2',3'-cyclic phosphodiesterase [Chitinophagales bacterium]
MTKVKETRRLFIAINLPEPVRNELAAVGSFFRNPAVRWTPAENLHITLHFIGETRLDEIHQLRKKITAVTAGASSFEITLDRLKVIKKHGRPVMIWARMQAGEGFQLLASQLQKNLPGDDTGTPVPHVTLARIKKGILPDIPAMPDVKQLSWHVHKFELMNSEPGNPAPVYSIVESYELKFAQ